MGDTGQARQDQNAKVQVVALATDETCSSRSESGTEIESRYQPLVIVAISVVAGISLDRYGGQTLFAAFDSASPSGVSMGVWWCLALGLLVAWWLVWWKRRNALAAWLLVGATALAAAAWHDARWSLFSSNEIARYANADTWHPACIEVIAREAPERLAAPPPTPLRAIPVGERSRLRVTVVAIRDGTTWRPAAGECEVVTEGHLLGASTGDRLRVFGQLGRPSPPRNPGEFDFAAHARADGHLARMRSSAPESVSVIDKAGSWNWRRAMDHIRAGCQGVLRQYVGPERAGLASAILLGAREGLPREETAAYLATGTVHLLVVSGLNVGILATGLYGAMRLGWLSRRVGLAVIIAAVAAYTVLTRSEPPVLRAAVLAVLLCVAAWTGRRAVAFNSLAAAALIVLVLNPAELFRAGTQLSFLCVAALIWVGNCFPAARQEGDRLDQLLAAVRPWHVRWSTKIAGWAFWLLVTTAVVWLASLPLVLYQFHILSPVAVPISPPVWLLIFVAMWSGFFLLLFGWMWPPLATLLGIVCNYSLAGLEFAVEWAEALPAGHSWWPGPAWWWVVGFYLALVAVMVWGRALVAPRWQVAALAAWIIVGLLPPLARTALRDQLEVAFVSVGHGTCVLIEGADGETLLYDAGSLGSPDYATESIASYLWHRGLKRIDGVVLSHADVDHYNALPGLLERFDVGTIYVSPVMFSGFGPNATSQAPPLLRAAIERAAVPLREVWSGDRLRVGEDVTIDVLHPPRRGVVGSDNANSITLAVESHGRRILLPGDLESPGLEDLTAELPYNCDVLLAPHHGSRRSDPPGFAAWSTPEWVVISGGSSDEVEPVVQTYERAGANVLNTHLRGTVLFTLDPGPIRVATWLNPVVSGAVNSP